MIARLRGEVVHLDDDSLVLDVNGVGYEVLSHPRALAAARAGELATFEIHTSVSDDAIRLYGFVNADELRLFRLLIGVDRIGPKAAMAIIGRAELPTLVRAISDADVALLATVPGIGRRTAERLALELHDKVGVFELALLGAGNPPPSAAVEAAVVALIGLGFREADARRAVAASPPSDDLNVTVAAALRQLDKAGGGS